MPGARALRGLGVDAVAIEQGHSPGLPPSIVVGIGAESGVPAEDFEAAVRDTLKAFGLAPERIRAIATLDRRAAEEGFGRWAAQHGWPVLTYTAEQLAAVRPVSDTSRPGTQTVATFGVCEPAAMLASGSQTLLVPKQKHGRVTVAIAQCTDSRATHLDSASTPTRRAGSRRTGASGGQSATTGEQDESATMPADWCEPSEKATAPETSADQTSHKVLFVGAGPGDAELLTLKGAKALAAADVVVYAGSLIPDGVLQHVRRGAVMHNSATLTLEEIHRLLAEAYRAGQRVVRLHSGDPSIYGAITEQMALLDEEDIPYDIVPGVSSFQAVAARLGLEYTQPGVVQTLILTRPGGRTGMPANESLVELARHGVTLCLFLSAGLVAEVQAALLTSYPPTTPVAVAYRATWPDEELTRGTLADLVEMVQGPRYDRTTLIIVGPSLQRQGKRSHVYDPSYQHRFRPGKGRGNGTASESTA
jgi:precorrin-4/cobalt-precorrin-4 C11-methyltransferase